MIIKRLRFKNLNSLAGEWEIDFSQPEYVSEGLFLIAGQTGVGKTTLLDAISLALYGQTPRLGKITKSDNEIIRKQTGECFAEVLFETMQGSYICHWSQRRARSKADGALQAPKHEIALADTGKVIEHMLSKTAAKVEEVCGLDFERFTRSIMLAQGDFAKFLSSTASERSDILEKITGTKIYSELSKHVHQRKTIEDSTLKELTDQMSGIQILSEEEHKELEASSKLATTELSKKKATLTKLQETQHWLQSIAKENQLIKATQQELQAHTKNLEIAKPEQATLEAAKQATEVEPHYQNYRRTDAEAKNLNTTLQKITSDLAQQQQKMKDSKKLADQQKKTLQQVKEVHSALIPKLAKAGEIHARVEEETNYSNTQRTQYKSLKNQADGIKQSIDQASSKLKFLTQSHAEAVNYLEKNTAYATLTTELSGFKMLAQAWKANLQQLTKTKHESDQLQEGSKQIKVMLQHEQQLFRKAEEQSSKLSEVVADINSETTNLLDGNTTENLEKKLSAIRAKRILDLEHLEQFREALTNDQPCPVCGSTRHPYADNAAPTHDETKLALQALEKRLSSISVLEKNLHKASIQQERQTAIVTQHQSKIQALQTQVTEKNKQLEATQKELLQLTKESAQQQSEIQHQCVAYGEKSAEVSNIGAIIEKLTNAAKTWRHHTESSKQYQTAKATIETSITAENKALTDLNERMSVIVEDGKKSVAKLQQFQADLKQLIGESTVDALKSKSDSDLRQAERSSEKQELLRQQTKATLETLQTRQAENAKRLEAVQSDRNQYQASYKQALVDQEFDDEANFLASRLDRESRDLLENKLQALKDLGNTLGTRLTDAQTRLQAETAKQISDLTDEQVTEQFSTISAEYEEINKSFGAISQQLETHKQSLQAREEKLKLRTKQEAECQRWTRLHNLMGSADGKKFRNFAQGLTFEVMVKHANDQLSKMTDRYLLVRDLDEPLELSVIDSYQAGETRSTKNLSGGESFIVSLALALGLSKMASKNIQVDSLFLDEGFGTLDEDALETAIDTLASMNQEGKIIGLISHIAALKDRITTQIKLERSSHGSATISGPGIRKMQE